LTQIKNPACGTGKVGFMSAYEFDTNRRRLLASGCVALAGMAVPRSLIAAPPAGGWDREYDVVVVGTGFAGSAAAIEAREAGAGTLLMDKMPVFGGNSAINGGAFAVVGSPHQQRRGVRDTVDLYVEDLLKAGRGLNQTDLVEIIARRGHDAYRFTVDRGVVYRDALGHFGGHSVPRTIWPEINSGSRITLPLQQHAAGIGVERRTRCIADQILVDDAGRVAGLQVREGYAFDYDPRTPEGDNRSGSTKYYKVNKGVVMTSGGFAYDLQYRQEIDPRLDTTLDCTNHYGATAHALKMMLRTGAKPNLLEWIQLGPWGSPDEQGFGIAPVFAIPCFAYGIMVDVANGRRFVNELADRRERALAILELKNADGSLRHPVAFCDVEGAKGTLKKNVMHGVDKDVIGRFDTIDALAGHYAIPLEALKDSVARYNRFVAAGRDEEFGKPLPDTSIDISRPPFFAFRAVPKVHHTMGGVQIDRDARVVSEATGSPIPGLFAAGEAVGGPHGASRLGSCAIPDCLVFGRIAGRNAAGGV